MSPQAAPRYAPRLLTVIITLFVLAKLALILTPHPVIWDEAVYIGMGKYIYSAGAVGLWEQIRPPGLPLLLGIFWKLGLDPAVFGELLAIAFAALTLWLIARIGRRVFGEREGITAALLVAVMPLFFLYSSYILTEIPSTLFVLLALDAFLAGRPFTAGLAAGGALLFRFPQGLALPIFCVLYFMRRDLKGLGKFLAGWAVPVLPFLAVNYVTYHAYTSQFWHAALRPLLLAAPHAANPAVPASNALYYLGALLGEAPYFAMLAVGFARRPWRYPRATAILALAIAYAGYFTFISNRQDRFLLQFLPYLALLTAPGITAALRPRVRARHALHRHALRAASAVTLLILIIGGAFALARDISFYSWRTTELAPITEYYRYFGEHPVTGAVLTADPVIAAYTDARLVPYYFLLHEKPLIVNEWERSLPIGGVAFVPRAFYCTEDDNACWTARVRLFDYFLANYRLDYQKTFYGEPYYMFTAAAS